MNNQPTAAIVIIGDEILSGRTQDKNVQFLAEQFSDLGILLKEVRVIRDDEEQIIATVNELRENHTHVVTTGGIGATHDDITASSVAKAFGVSLYKDQEAVEMIEKYLKEKHKIPSGGTFITANVPEGCKLIKNSVSGAPGFTIGNVHVLAGIPEIVESMFQDLSTKLEKGKRFNSRSIKVNKGEGFIIHILSDVQERHKSIQIGSYPFEENNNWCTTIVIRGQDLSEVKLVTQELKDIFNRDSIEFTVEK